MCSHEAAAVVEITPQKQGKEIIVAVYVNGDSNFVFRCCDPFLLSWLSLA